MGCRDHEPAVSLLQRDLSVRVHADRDPSGFFQPKRERHREATGEGGEAGSFGKAAETQRLDDAIRGMEDARDAE